MFIDYIPEVYISMVLGCTENELTELLDSTPVDDTVIKDFMNLARRVEDLLKKN